MTKTGKHHGADASYLLRKISQKRIINVSQHDNRIYNLSIEVQRSLKQSDCSTDKLIRVFEWCKIGQHEGIVKFCFLVIRV